MTTECAIKELKEDIDLYIPLHGTIDDVDRELPDGRLITALEMAIASLEAWGEIKQEINDLFNKPAYYMPNYDAYKMFLEIIDKHLQKTSETETWNGYHGQITAPKGTFERIISDTDDEDDI